MIVAIIEFHVRPGAEAPYAWRDAAALAAWRREPEHQRGRAAGKRDIFADYRIVVAAVERDYAFARAGA